MSTNAAPWTPSWTPPYALLGGGAGRWILVDTSTGEVEDEFDDEALARQTLAEQLAA